MVHDTDYEHYKSINCIKSIFGDPPTIYSPPTSVSRPIVKRNAALDHKDINDIYMNDINDTMLKCRIVLLKVLSVVEDRSNYIGLSNEGRLATLVKDSQILFITYCIDSICII